MTECRTCCHLVEKIRDYWYWLICWKKNIHNIYFLLQAQPSVIHCPICSNKIIVISRLRSQRDPGYGRDRKEIPETPTKIFSFKTFWWFVQFVLDWSSLCEKKLNWYGNWRLYHRSIFCYFFLPFAMLQPFQPQPYVTQIFD